MMDMLSSAIFWKAFVQQVSFGIFAVFATVFIHEFGHAVAGWCYGLRISEFRVRPLGGYCTFRDDARSDHVFGDPLSRGILYAAGPLANALTCVIALTVPLLSHSPTVYLAAVTVAVLNGGLVLEILFRHRSPMTDGAQVREAWAEYWENRRN